jgi:hypothetical protein
MIAATVTLARAVRFYPGEVAHRTKTTMFPDLHEFVDPGPSIKGGAELIGLEDTKYFPKCRTKPVVGIVTPAPPAIPRSIFYEIRRVGDDQVNTGFRELR